MALGKSLVSGLGKAAKLTGTVGDRLSGRAAMTAIAGGAFFAGMANKVGPAAMDATMEAAFGDPNADRYFTGRDLSFRTMAGGFLGGNIGGAMRLSSSQDLMATNPVVPPLLETTTATGGIGTVTGAIGGALLAAKRGKGAKGKVIGGVIGGLAGGIAGSGLGAGAALSAPITYMRNNKQFFSQSPYSPMTSNSGNLNASGDIVLGMHNSRRGY